MARKRTGKCKQGRLGHRAVLSADFDEPVRSDAPDRIAAPRAVVDVEENPEYVLSERDRFLCWADIDADELACIRRGERTRQGRVEPVVRASGEAKVRDPVAVVVAVRLRVRNPVVVEVQRHRIDDVRNGVPVRVGERRGVLERHGLRRLRDGCASKDPTQDVGVEERRRPPVLGAVSTDVNVRIRTGRHVV